MVRYPLATNCMNALDTNIWVYLHDTSDPRKQLRAKRVVTDAQPLVLPWQVGCEFLAASRKLQARGFDHEMSWDALEDIIQLAAEIVLPSDVDWTNARNLQRRYSLSIWDALLIATCMRHGVTTLYTEDMGAPRTIAGLALVNPFAD